MTNDKDCHLKHVPHRFENTVNKLSVRTKGKPTYTVYPPITHKDCSKYRNIWYSYTLDRFHRYYYHFIFSVFEPTIVNLKYFISAYLHQIQKY